MSVVNRNQRVAQIRRRKSRKTPLGFPPFDPVFQEFLQDRDPDRSNGKGSRSCSPS